MAQERTIEPLLLDLAYDNHLPIVATNEPYFASPDDYEAHDALHVHCRRSYVGEDQRRRLSPEHYFKSERQMAELFADLPEAIENTIEIARRCAFRPREPRRSCRSSSAARRAEAQGETEAAELRRQSRQASPGRLEAAGHGAGLRRRGIRGASRLRDRRHHRHEVSGYFLIVADFIKWAKAKGIPVGPGRGSGAGSLVAWALTITDLDPMRFGLLFERFLNPERVSMPDFDIDFCQDRRDEVIAYVRESYGDDRVAQIITFGKLQARAVLRDVGRVLQMPYGQVDRLCKLVPNNPANPVTLPQAIDGEPSCRRRATPSRWWRGCSISASSSRGYTATPRPMPPAWSSPTGR